MEYNLNICTFATDSGLTANKKDILFRLDWKQDT